MAIVFDSLDPRCKLPIGCVKVKNEVCFRVNLDTCDNPNYVELIFRDYKTGEIFSVPMQYAGHYGDKEVFEAKFYGGETRIFRYHFEYNSNGVRKYIKRKRNGFEGEIRSTNEGDDWQLSVYVPVNTHINMQGGAMYQIFPDRFCRESDGQTIPEGRKYLEWERNDQIAYERHNVSLDFFGGNIKGITKKLGFLKSLGVTVLYLNPIWWAGTNHRYDANNYKVIDPLLGTEEDLKELMSKAHSLDMIVILDAVLNHTGWGNVYFKEACESQESPYYDWYTFINHPDNYECWWGDRSLPKLNQESRSLQEHLYGEGGVIDYWYDLGIDGVRLDVVDEYPDAIVEKINVAAKRSGKPIVIIGEVWEDASCKVSYGNVRKYLLGSELTSVMNYPVKDAILAYIRYGEEERWVQNLWYTLNLIFIENYPKEIAHSLMNLLSTHDTVRAITKLAGPEVDGNDVYWQKNHDVLSNEEYQLGKMRLKIGYLLLYFIPGIPSVFYGDEAGLSGQKDPFCRKCYPWENEDSELISFFTRIGSMRTDNCSFFAEADFKVVHIDHEKCILERMTPKRKFRLIINRTGKEINVLASNLLGEKFEIVFEVHGRYNGKTIEPYSGVVLEIF